MITADMVRAEIEPHRERYIAKLAAGQPERWSPDQRTKDCWCLVQWLDERFAADQNCPNEIRIRLGSYFNRKSRAADDLFDLAAKTIGHYEAGTVEPFPRR